MAKVITSKQIGYQIVGLTALALWGGGEGTIPMEPVKLTQEDFPTEQQIRDAINDNGFGVECMEGAVVRVDTIYEHGAKTYGDALFVNLSRYSDQHVANVLSNGHPDSTVDIWGLSDRELTRLGI